MDMEPIGLCRMVDRLEAAGLVRRERDSADRRARRLYLTRAGWDRLDQLRPLGQDLAAKGCAGINPAQLGTACAVLGQIVANLSAEALAGETS
jgi:MarR family transcriptional regulator, transcriptional regulator for hemolysin